jgi:hypothetical protein
MPEFSIRLSSVSHAVCGLEPGLPSVSVFDLLDSRFVAQGWLF